MADQIKVYYTRLHNMGDRLNELIIEKCFGYEVARCSFLDGELCAIGSCLGMYTLHGTFLMRIRQRFNGIVRPRVSIWGTGFINYSDCEGRFFKRNMDFCAVRGELTRKRVEQMTGLRLDIPTADAGILASELLEELPPKCYDVGVVPHLCDLKDPKASELLLAYAKGEEDLRQAENVRLINVKDEPLKVVKEIAQCRYILSSSLHGLIVADSLGISEGHLSHLFRKETDSTLMAFVTKKRMRVAMSLLQDYSHKVYEVAEQVGYRNITYFSATFKKYVGVSPSEYQNRYSPE